ncbi:MAG: formate dehydrogenase subunit gamma [Phycisphaerae bacterium]|nr:formate dehydrogenase subunit gamma [Phycisphaerae bacterium]
MSRLPIQRGSAWTCFAAVALMAALAHAGAPVHTGSQATYVHRIQLFDADGKLITPESKVPFSTKRTCGKCHDYPKISMGWHFQAGFHEPGAKEGLPVADPRPGEPFFLADPNSGTQIPTSFRQWARGIAMSPADLGMKPFDFALAFGAYIPGGGVLENALPDKDGKVARLAGEPWDKTGVLEIDCLICHLRTGYNPEMRSEQIRYHNLKWSATAAAGLGLIRGEASKAGEAAEEEVDPTEVGDTKESAGGVSVEVDYNAAKFDKGNFITIDVTRHIPVTNCLFCHYSRLRDHGDGPDHQRVRDIHYDAGLLCTDCHKNDLDHRISRGDASPADLARDKDNATLSCQGCHYVGRAAAPKDDHPGLPEFHLKDIACTACHSGFEPGEKVAAQLTAIGHRLGLSTEDNLTQRKVPGIYGPVWKRDADRGPVGLFRYAYPRWWGQKTDKGITPLPLAKAATAVKAAGEAVKDDDKDGKPEVNTDAEIAAVLAAMAKSVGDKAKPVLVARGGVYESEQPGKVVWSALALAQPYYWPQAHPVRPAREALGAGGCTDCHDEDEPFYMIRTLVDDTTEPAPPVRSYNLLHTSESMVELSEFREESVKAALVWIIPIIAGLCLLHYVTFGPKQVDKDEPDAATRFSVLERWMHLFLFLAFVALCATAVGFLTNKLPFARGNFWTSHWALELHEIAGFIFAGATVVVTLRWFVTAIPAKYDVEWCKMLGGYLWIKGHPPAGKFNFGQKMFFWAAMALAIVLSITGITMWLKPGGDDGWATIAYTLHDLCAVLLIAFAVVHLYLGSIANPGTLRAIFTGRVTKAWAHTHHPNWAETLEDKPGESSH